MRGKEIARLIEEQPEQGEVAQAEPRRRLGNIAAHLSTLMLVGAVGGGVVTIAAVQGAADAVSKTRGTDVAEQAIKGVKTLGKLPERAMVSGFVALVRHGDTASSQGVGLRAKL